MNKRRPYPRSRNALRQRVYVPNKATDAEKREARRQMDALDTLAELRKAWGK